MGHPTDQLMQLLAVKGVRVRHLSRKDWSMIQWRESVRDLQVGHQAHSKVVQDSGDLDQAGEVLKVGLVDGADLLDTGDLALRVLR